METKFVHFAGVDVSKQKIDVCVMVNNQRSEILYNCFDQSKKGFNGLKKWLIQVTSKQPSKLLICVENTGLYDDALLYYLSDNDLAVSLENAAHIKRSIRDNRSKTDKLDARNIALYAMKHHDELRLWERPRKSIALLQQMLSERSRLVNALKMLQQVHGEQQVFSWSGRVQSKSYQSGIKGLKKDIEQIEKDLWELIKSDKELLQMFMLIISIPSVGKIYRDFAGDSYVSLLELVSGNKLIDDLMEAYHQLNDKCKKAFIYTSLLYQYKILMPSSLLCSLVTSDWVKFRD